MNYQLSTSRALSPLDGRYAEKTEPLRACFSESALIQHRLMVEIEWLIHLCNEVKLEGTRKLTTIEVGWLKDFYRKFTPKIAESIKKIEKTTNHDVKAVEYFLKEKMAKHSTKPLSEFLHFGCTSEDINNLAYGMMLKKATTAVMLPTLEKVQTALEAHAKAGAAIPMLGHTHGQPASPTTVGKEMANVLVRLAMQTDHLLDQTFHGKMNGAVGNWNAHHVAYPEIDWVGISYKFIEELGLTPMVMTTQIEPHDYLAELAHTFSRINTVLLDLSRDLWLYISKNAFIQRIKAGEVGSSTMPHKVNPIDFENAEGNLGLANAVLGHMAEKLPLSRLQRDLTDSTVMRNWGVAFGYSLLAYESLLKGLGKIEINAPKLAEELNAHWEVLGEALQTVMRRYKIAKPYEKLKNLTRGKSFGQKEYQKFVKSLKIPPKEKARLARLTPATYIGLAENLTRAAL